mmetsp:Transcript_110714/g.352651  ORF Transcript_110714/g.352651 Transcript_110714/m.352651 type:complete len:112 (-) Transcript_110714:50-385(-)
MAPVRVAVLLLGLLALAAAAAPRQRPSAAAAAASPLFAGRASGVGAAWARASLGKGAATEHVLMQVYSDLTPAADRASKFRVKKVRREAAPLCESQGAEEVCPAYDDISLR